jgi:hypothetical protein
MWRGTVLRVVSSTRHLGNANAEALEVHRHVDQRHDAAMKRGLFAWLVTLALAGAGSQFAHAADYRILVRDAEERRDLLAATGHGYLTFLPLFLALCTVVVTIAFVGQARQARFAASDRPAAWHFGLVAPLLFCCQEHFERLAHDGSFPWDTVLQPTFVVGVVLQVPFALVAFAFAWLLLRAARVVGRLFRAAPRARRACSLVVGSSRDVDVPRLPALALGFGTRGPPVAFAA